MFHLSNHPSFNDPISMNNTGRAHLSSTLKDLDQALNDWEKIVVPEGEAVADQAPEPTKRPAVSEALNQARSLLEKLRQQIDDFEK